jgi:hypothetical protein
MNEWNMKYEICYDNMLQTHLSLSQVVLKCVRYEEESKSNLNMAIKSQNHVVDGCTTDMLCPPA